MSEKQDFGIRGSTSFHFPSAGSPIPHPIVHTLTPFLKQLWFYFLCTSVEVSAEGTCSEPSPPFLMSFLLQNLPTEHPIISASTLLARWWPWRSWSAPGSYGPSPGCPQQHTCRGAGGQGRSSGTILLPTNPLIDSLFMVVNCVFIFLIKKNF